MYEDRLSLIVGADVMRIARNGAECWISFCEYERKEDDSDLEIEKERYSLHFNVPWKIIDNVNSKILIASHDVFKPDSGSEWLLDYEWDAIGKNLFDEKAVLITGELREKTVLSVDVNNYADLNILFSNGWNLTSFTDKSADEEAWYLWKLNGRETVLVGSGVGLRLE